jgi:hypothetical protein
MPPRRLHPWPWQNKVKQPGDDTRCYGRAAAADQPTNLTLTVCREEELTVIGWGIPFLSTPRSHWGVGRDESSRPPPLPPAGNGSSTVSAAVVASLVAFCVSSGQHEVKGRNEMGRTSQGVFAYFCPSGKGHRSAIVPLSPPRHATPASWHAQD